MVHQVCRPYVLLQTRNSQYFHVWQWDAYAIANATVAKDIKK